MRLFILHIFLITLLYGTNICAKTQIPPDSTEKKTECVQKDVLDLIFKKNIVPGISTKRKFSIIAIPVLSYSPTTGVQIGAGASLSWPWGRDIITKLSAGIIQVVWTTEKQIIIQVKNNIYTNRNKWFLQTDWRLYIFRLPTYGLSTGSGETAYQMLYDWIKFHNIFSREVTHNVYIGIGYHLDYHYNIVDESLSLEPGDSILTPHYSYSTLHGFDLREYWSSGISANFVFDSRDNIINAYKGIYVNVNYRYNATWLGSSQNGSQLWTEFRTYIGLSKRVPRHLIAFWIYGSFQITGEIPYLDLMSVGFDQMNSSGRGYKQGRWRGEDLVYGEMEYRFPISRCTGILGGVLFMNVTSASDRDARIPLFAYLKPGAGFGLRIMVGKHDRTNLLIDFALGQLSHGLYFQAQEIF